MSSCSDDLLSTLVKSIRQACEQNITFEDFTSVSGLICFDIDGLKQKSFVISELLKKKSVGEGNSSHLKTINWKGVERNEAIGLQEFRGSPTKPFRTVDSNYCRLLGGQEDLQKRSNGSHGSFAILNTKLDWCNRTFTLKPKIGNGVEPTGKGDLKETKETITKSNKASLIERQENFRLGDKRNIHLGSGYNTIVCERKWQKCTNSSKVKTNHRNCYPGLPNRPLKKCQSPNIFKINKPEKPTLKYSNEYISEPLKESGRRGNTKQTKTLFKSPSEKPTALSWYETSIAPSSSFESIESIQPFYLVPHSEPLSYPTHYDNENIGKHSDNKHVENEDDSLQYASEVLKETDPSPPVSTTIPEQEARGDSCLPLSPLNQESPAKNIATHRTASSGTLNTISSIEPDVHTVKESKPQKSSKMENHDSKHLSGARDETFMLSESSATSKKRASLMKWMGLFKKGSKTSSNETNVNQKQMAMLNSGKAIPEPPMAIRLKQWK